jgi:hypothetical protein
MGLGAANFHQALVYLLHIGVKVQMLIESEGWYKQVDTARVKKPLLVTRMSQGML